MATSNLLNFLRQTEEYTEEQRETYEYQNTLNRLLNEEFPNAFYSICLSAEELLRLDEPMTDKKKIKLIDTNINPFNIYYSQLPLEQIQKMKKAIYVYQKDNQPITLRQVLDTMRTHRHFKGFKGEDDHIFLEGIIQISPDTYELWFGS